MKLKSSRRYKNDLSDIIGILSEHRKNEEPISFNMIDTAVCNLYGGWEAFSDDSLKYIQNLLDIENYDEAYQSIRDNEISAKGILLDLQNQDVLNEENINVILNKKIGSRSDIIHLLSNKKK